MASLPEAGFQPARLIRQLHTPSSLSPLSITAQGSPSTPSLFLPGQCKICRAFCWCRIVPPFSTRNYSSWRAYFRRGSQFITPRTICNPSLFSPLIWKPDRSQTKSHVKVTVSPFFFHFSSFFPSKAKQTLEPKANQNLLCSGEGQCNELNDVKRAKDFL